MISLNEQIRDKDERERETDDESRRLHDDLAKLKIKEGDLRSVVGEKDNMIQVGCMSVPRLCVYDDTD